MNIVQRLLGFPYIFLVSIYGRLDLRSQSGSEQDKNSKHIYLKPLCGLIPCCCEGACKTGKAGQS